MIRKYKVTRTNPKEHGRGRKKHSVRFMAAFMAAVLTLSVPATALPIGAADSTMQEASSGVEDTSSGQSAADNAADSESHSASKLTGEEDNYQVTLSYDKSSVTNIPDDAHLKITPLKATDDAYQTAREAVIREKKSADNSFDEDTLGMDAVDISIMNADNSKEIEPNGKVDVQIQLKQLPDGVDSNTDLEVQHILNTGIDTVNENSVSTLTAPTRRLVRRSPAANAGSTAANSEAQTAQTVLNGTKAGQVLQFSVESFSVFTITWTTKSGDNDVRFANVKVHYVDENGLELTDPTTVPASELNDGSDEDPSKNNNIVDLSKWAYTTDSDGNVTTTSRVDGYTFQKAAIGTLKGTQITGLKASKDAEENEKTAYRLYYTSSTPVNADSAWTQYKDPTSRTASNNADVYLIYVKGNDAPATIHFMAKTSNNWDVVPIRDSSGKDLVETIDASGYKGTEWNVKNETDDLAVWARSHNPNGYSFTSGDPNSGAYYILRSPSNHDTFFRFLNYDSTKKKLQYARADKKWNDFENNPDIYITYSIADTLPITVHQIDENGNTLDDKTVSVTVNSNTVSASSVEAPTGYIAGNLYYEYTNSSNKGISFSNMVYTKDNYAWTSTPDSGSATSGPISEIWIEYTKKNTVPVTIHHVDQNGNKIADSTSVSIDAENKEVIAENLKRTDVTGFVYSDAYFKNGNTQTTFSSLQYNYDQNTAKWSTTYRVNSDDAYTAASSVVYDIYLVYSSSQLTQFTIHRVDESGGKLAADEIIPTGTSNSAPGNFNNQWNGYSGVATRDQLNNVGSVQKAYIGYNGNSTYEIGNSSSLNYYYDSTAQKWHTGTGTSATSANKEFISVDPYFTSTVSSSGTVNNDPILLTDVYQVYGGLNAKKGVTIHYVDTNGKTIANDTYANATSGSKISYTSLSTASIDGYALDSAHLGSYTGTAFSSITYTYHSNQKNWSDTYETMDEKESSSSSAVNEVWLVYKKGGITKTFTAHYVYLDENGNVRKTDTPDVSFAISTDTAKKTDDGLGHGGNPQYALMGDGINTVANDEFFGTVDKPKPVKGDNGKSLSYVTTRMGSETGPELSWVKLDSSGQVLYLTGSSRTDDGNASTTYQLTRQGGRNIWTYASNSRTFTLTEDSTGNFKLSDSLTGNVDLDLMESGGSAPTYTATYREANQVTQFVVKLNTNVGVNANTNYTLTIEDWIPSNSTNLYFIYRDLSKEIYIDNDLIYSGRLKVAYSDDVRKKMEQDVGTEGAVKNTTYTWYKITTDDTTKNASSLTDEEKNSGTEVLRTESGTEWNMAYQQSGRTWLNVAVDKGQRTTSQKVFYRVKMEYDDGTEGAKRQTLWTDPVEIGYYGELENGSFETPDKENKDTPATREGDYSNADYKEYGGVWQTTGLGSNNSKQNQKDKDIEIVDTRPISQQRGEPEYLSPYAFPYGSVEGAADGNQFAELNAEEAGALYQDVITLNNENLNYWLSHRARGQEGRPAKTTYHYDTMYLVIMPTKIAMTSGADGGELASQKDLEAFLQSHGGYEESGNGNSHTSEEETVTYPEDESGIYVVRITSDNMNWHSVRAVNAYIARSNVTRFFFVAGPTAYTGNQDSSRDKTIGNLIDAVGFSQGLPTPKGFNLTVTKTFSGLTSAQIASMASNASDVTGTDLRDGKTDHFTITLNNKHVDLSANKEDEDSTATPANTALNGAKLTFTASGSGGSYSFTPVATGADGSTNLFSGQSSGTSRVNADGSVTMTWTFADQIVDGTGADQTFNYTASESGEIVNGFTINSTKTVSPQSYINKEAVEIRRGSNGTINFVNTYSRHRDSDQPEITVRKTFSGVTRATVDKLWSNGYHITVGTNLSGETNVTANLSKYSDQNSAGVTLVSGQENENDGSITYVWAISGEKWRPGSFTVTESGIRTADNELQKVTMESFGEGSQTSESIVTPNGEGDTASRKISIQSGAAASLHFDESTRKEIPSSEENNTVTETVDEGTNIIIAQFKIGNSTTNNYLVWTPTPLGHATSNAIINQIKTVFDDTNANLESQVFFRSGSNPGAITANGTTMSYDSGSRTLVFTNTRSSTSESGVESEAHTWQAFYSTHYRVGDDTASPETYDDQDIKIANVYSPVVRIKKVSADDNASLKGAVFRVYMKDSDGHKQYYLSTSTTKNAEFGIVSGNIDENTTSERTESDRSNSSAEENDSGGSATAVKKALSFTTDSSGQIVIGSFPIPENSNAVRTYYLEEVKAPDGYNRTIDIPFVVQENGTVQLVDFADASTGQTTRYVTSTTNAEVSREDSYYAITVKDKPGYRLPSTGGPGRNILFWLLGFAITAAALVYLNQKGYFDPVKKSLRMRLRKRGGQKV